MDDTPATLLASQPIYDREGRVAAAELLFRNDLEQNVTEVGEERATSQLLYNLCTGITDQVAHSGIPVFLNVSADFLLSRAFLPVPPRQVVIELVERIEPTPEVIESVAHWSRQGFRFALDDFEFAASWDPLLAYADIIKVDVLGADPEQVLARKAALAHLPVRWLAERIETREEYELYRAAGFDLFQGYFFARPRTVLGTALPPSTLQLARLHVLPASGSRHPRCGLRGAWTARRAARADHRRGVRLDHKAGPGIARPAAGGALSRGSRPCLRHHGHGGELIGVG